MIHRMVEYNSNKFDIHFELFFLGHINSLVQDIIAILLSTQVLVIGTFLVSFYNLKHLDTQFHYRYCFFRKQFRKLFLLLLG